MNRLKELREDKDIIQNEIAKVLGITQTGYSKYEVVYILDDEIKETIEAKVENGYIVFETSHLSHYGIVAIEENNNIVNPKTNDDIVMYFISSIISLVGVTGVLIYYRKKQN